MADPPVTKKEFVNLEKLVDRMVKEFDEEKKVVHDKLAALTKSTDNTQLQKSVSELKKWADDTFNERKKWFDDEKKVVHDSLDAVSANLNRMDAEIKRGEQQLSIMQQEIRAHTNA